MNLKFKKPSKETQNAMSKVASGEDNHDYHSMAEEKLVNITNHHYANLVSSGNSAILSAMNSIDGAILIPDQGAWNGFKQIANFLNKDLITVKTNKGLIDLDNLNESIIAASENNMIDLDDENNKSALFLTSFAAYTAEQDLKAICDFAHKNNILVVEDASGAIGDYENRLANGDYSDVIIVSTGSPKIVNVEDGGFITTNDDKLFEKSKLLLKTNNASNITACGIYNELNFAKDNLKKTVDACSYLKEAIEEKTSFNVFHKDKRGINVILETEDPKSLSYKLRQEFVLDSHGMITKCPNYNRLKEKAVALEIKNLDIGCLSQDNLDEIIKTLKCFDN
ncbi:MAG: DegT/DnrJ/EryC1/StrS family aminotransferase [Methanobrevibacter sp.]|uniref:DegT/DnrJ/EryC1/StrS family aminotransferase n=1 Tax=Methanobrevibacter sp. TaxID=66852 RepID=UPI0025D25E57|nr:DegT/DnrJ/EryC1/StrS family aminotransferase [Methanobrevibacter sp.]MBQ6139100.1 DegT/DnrJ/EryC1/StrS family aminotransferase [Methanobrevibacter sp.]